MTPVLGVQHLGLEAAPPRLMVTSPTQFCLGMQSRREGLAGIGGSGGWASRGTICPHSLPEAVGAVLPEFLGA